MVAKAKKVERKNNKNLITIVLLIVAGIVILSYSNSTGRSVSNIEKIKLSSVNVGPRFNWDDEINPGDYITIKFKPGTYGYEGYYEIYKKGNPDKRMIGRTRVSAVAGCSMTCKKEWDQSVKTGDWEPGIYYVKVYDKSRERAGRVGDERYIKAEFKVV